MITSKYYYGGCILKSNLFRNKPFETRNQKKAFFNHMKQQVKSKYDTLMK